MTVNEAFIQFKSEHPEVQIEKSSFYNLRPPHVMPVSQTPHNVCVCKYHANVNFLIQSLRDYVPGFPSSGKDLLAMICCSISNETCMVGLCPNCENESVLKLLGDIDTETPVTWKQWKTTDGFQKVTVLDGSIDELSQELLRQLSYFKIHCYIKSVQENYFREKKTHVLQDEAVLQMILPNIFQLYHKMRFRVLIGVTSK